AMHDACAMRLAERFGELCAEADDFRQRQRALCETIGERLSLQQLHDEIADAVVVADVVQCADVGMRELRDRLRLALEADLQLGILREFVRKNLDRDRAIEPRIARLEYLPHPARANPRDDLIRPKKRAARNIHEGSRLS